MCMVLDKSKNRVLVQKREKYWTGFAFPGGHVEIWESYYDSTVREVKEETGLTVENLQICGLIHWDCLDDGEQYLVYLYRTTDFSGELLDRTEEGAVFWMDIDELQSQPDEKLCPYFRTYLRLFLDDTAFEAHATYSDITKEENPFEFR